jgi:hypothetical protein
MAASQPTTTKSIPKLIGKSLLAVLKVFTVVPAAIAATTAIALITGTAWLAKIGVATILEKTGLLSKADSEKLAGEKFEAMENLMK